MRKAKTDSLATRVLEVIQTNPGGNATYIAEQLGVEATSVSGALAYHRREGRIVNQGKAARGASWYPTYDTLDSDGKDPIASQDWREALLAANTSPRRGCKKCGNMPTVARIMLTAQEKDDNTTGRAQKFTSLSSKTAMLCANCIVGVYQAVEVTLLDELGESE